MKREEILQIQSRAIAYTHDGKAIGEFIVNDIRLLVNYALKFGNADGKICKCGSEAVPMTINKKPVWTCHKCGMKWTRSKRVTALELSNYKKTGDSK